MNTVVGRQLMYVGRQADRYIDMQVWWQMISNEVCGLICR